MSITSAAGVAQATALGCERVVLARELALPDGAPAGSIAGQSIGLRLLVRGRLDQPLVLESLESERGFRAAYPCKRLNNAPLIASDWRSSWDGSVAAAGFLNSWS